MRGEEMRSERFGKSARRRGGRGGVRGWSWMGGVRAPVIVRDLVWLID